MTEKVSCRRGAGVVVAVGALAGWGTDATTLMLVCFQGKERVAKAEARWRWVQRGGRSRGSRGREVLGAARPGGRGGQLKWSLWRGNKGPRLRWQGNGGGGTAAAGGTGKVVSQVKLLLVQTMMFLS